jgi:tol-pal system protein YbgF
MMAFSKFNGFSKLANWRSYVAAGLCLAVVVGTATPTLAQGGAIVDELERLRRDLGDLQKFVYQNRPSPQATSNRNSGDENPQQAQFNAGIQRQIQSLQDQMRGLTGRLEEVQHQIGTVGARLDKLVGDVDLRLQALEQNAPAAAEARPNVGPGAGYVGGVNAQQAPFQSTQPGTTVITSSGVQQRLVEDPQQPPSMRTLGTVSQSTVEAIRRGESVDVKAGSATIAPGMERQAAARDISARSQQSSPVATPVPPSVAVSNSNIAMLRPTPSVLPPGSPKDQYAYALSLLRKRDYQGAETALRAFVDQHPDNKLSGNAMFWMGKTFYVRKNYTEAARIFLDGYQRFPKGAKAADSLLELAKSLSELGEKKSACASYKKLLDTFPKASNRMLSVAKNAVSQLKCG